MHHPLRVFPRHPLLGGDPLRLEPEDELHAELVSPVADRLQSAWEGVGLGDPIARARRPASLEPAGVQPERLDAGRRHGQHGGQLVGFRRGVPFLKGEPGILRDGGIAISPLSRGT